VQRPGACYAPRRERRRENAATGGLDPGSALGPVSILFLVLLGQWGFRPGPRAAEEVEAPLRPLRQWPVSSKEQRKAQGAKCTDVPITVLDTAEGMNYGVCLDGSPRRTTSARGWGEGAHKWLVFLEGGAGAPASWTARRGRGRLWGPPLACPGSTASTNPLQFLHQEPLFFQLEHGVRALLRRGLLCWDGRGGSAQGGQRMAERWRRTGE